MFCGAPVGGGVTTCAAVGTPEDTGAPQLGQKVQIVGGSGLLHLGQFIFQISVSFFGCRLERRARAPVKTFFQLDAAAASNMTSSWNSTPSAMPTPPVTIAAMPQFRALREAARAPSRSPAAALPETCAA